MILVCMQIFIVWMQKREEKGAPLAPEWKLDEGVADADECRAAELAARYGTEERMALPDSCVIHKSVRGFAERYSRLEFDECTMDYDRRELLRGEETEECWKGFYCIGGDGGEISFYVRKSADDERIYAFDMEGSSRPEPYASNIRRFIVMRHNAWLKMQKMIAEDEAEKQAKKNRRRRRRRG